MRNFGRVRGRSRASDMDSAEAAGPTDDGTQPHVLVAVAVYTLVAILAASVISLLVVRRNVEQNSMQKVSERTAYTARTVIPARLSASDLRKPLAGARLLAFEKAVRHDLLADGTKRVKIYNAEGLTVYASDHRLIGKQFEHPSVFRQVLAGESKAEIVNLNHEGGAGPDAKVVESYAPIVFRGTDRAVGVFEQYADYALAASAIRKQATQLSVVLMIVLLMLYVSLLPILRRTTRALALSNQELRRRAGDLKEHLEQRAEIEARLRQTIDDLKRSEDSLALSQEETIMRLSIAVESRDSETGSHIERMGRYCALLADRLGWPDERVVLLRMASPLHDVGKIAIPDAILLKPGALTADERTGMERHAEIGHRILAGSESPLLDLAARIALTHHERWDGCGYPNGLAGEDIPIEGRIAAIADVFDALTSDRVYRPAMEISVALKILVDGRGTHFDSNILDVFFGAIDEVIAIRDGQGSAPQPIREGTPARRRRHAPDRSSTASRRDQDADDTRHSLVG